MEGSKSGGNQKNIQKNIQTTENEETVVEIVESTVEREIQNVLMTIDMSQPCCSWKDGTPKSDPTICNETEIKPVEKSSEPSTISVVPESSNYDCPPTIHDNHDIFESSRNFGTEENQNLDLVSGSLIGLFDGLEPIRQPPSDTAPPTYPERPEDIPPTATRGISVVNFPDVPMIQVLQRGPPPSYSKSLLDRRINPCASIQFVAPIPPPSYDGMDSELRYAAHSGFTLGLGNTWQSQPQPAYCPVCETVTITRTDVRISRIAHFIAVIMFFLLCWPFCLLPYFLNVCNYTFHFCSVCHCYLGARRPFQRA